MPSRQDTSHLWARSWQVLADSSAPCRRLLSRPETNTGGASMIDDPSRSEAYRKNTREQHESLGQFVEAFEAMVHEAREVCIDSVSLDGRHRDLVQILLHHSSLTSKPIFEKCRAVIAEESILQIENRSTRQMASLKPTRPC